MSIIGAAEQHQGGGAAAGASEVHQAERQKKMGITSTRMRNMLSAISRLADEHRRPGRMSIMSISGRADEHERAGG